MRTYLIILASVTLALPAYARGSLKHLAKLPSLPGQFSRQLNAAVTAKTNTVMRTASLLSTGKTLSPTKQILNQHFQFKLEYRRAAQLYSRLTEGSVSPDPSLRQDINTTIINNTLRNSLLTNLDLGHFSGMRQDMEQYFGLESELPMFSTNAMSDEAFAISARGYLMTHAHKPSWKLREIIKFGGMRTLKPQLTESPGNGLAPSETDRLMTLYTRAEELNAQVKQFISQEHTPLQNNDAILDTLREMYGLYDELLTFARNSQSVTETLEIYQNLLHDIEAFLDKHHRFPVWANPEERPLSILFDPLVFYNQANMFEEMVPLMERLYELTEMYPAQRLEESPALREIQTFYDKHHFLPRSVHNRDFFDTKPSEALLYEAMLYWKNHSADFAKKINKLTFPSDGSSLPPYF